MQQSGGPDYIIVFLRTRLTFRQTTCLTKSRRYDWTEIEVIQRFTIPQHSSKKFCPDWSNLIEGEIQVSQCSTLCHQFLEDITLRENSFGFVILLFINQIILFPTDYPQWRGPEVFRCESYYLGYREPQPCGLRGGSFSRVLVIIQLLIRQPSYQPTIDNES